MYDICSQLTVKTPERRRWYRSGVFIVNLEQVTHIALVFPLISKKKKTISKHRRPYKTIRGNLG